MATATATHISEVNLVCVPATDQDRSIAFYESLGFEKRTDVPFGDKYRWVEVYPPRGTTGIALAPPRDGEAAARDTGIILASDDLESSHAHLSSIGVDVDDEISRMGGPVPPMFWVRDPDGHSLIVVETD
jgi:catechol 2,3-dioxygenase-like lactoylglutathione lyase family enzyme